MPITEQIQRFKEHVVNVDLVPRDDEFEDFLFEIDERSRKICEICGENGFFTMLDGWAL